MLKCMIYVCKSKCMFKSELWIFTEKIGNTLHGLDKFHLGIFAVKKVSESCPINNFQVNRALVTPETYISCLSLSFRILPPFHHLPTHIGRGGGIGPPRIGHVFSKNLDKNRSSVAAYMAHRGDSFIFRTMILRAYR